MRYYVDAYPAIYFACLGCASASLRMCTCAVDVWYHHGEYKLATFSYLPYCFMIASITYAIFSEKCFLPVYQVVAVTVQAYCSLHVHIFQHITVQVYTCASDSEEKLNFSSVFLSIRVVTELKMSANNAPLYSGESRRIV